MSETPPPIPGRVIHANLASALAAVHIEMPVIGKSQTATVQPREKRGYTFDYADLGDIHPVALPIIGKHGLAWQCAPLLNDGKWVLECRLTHAESGEERVFLFPLITADTPTMQSFGSATTYARRYALQLALSIATDEPDDDGGAASGHATTVTSRRSDAGANVTPAAVAAVQRQPQAAAPKPSDPPASDAQKRLLNARADENKLSNSQYANVVKHVAAQSPVQWASEDDASVWLHRAMDRLPARLVTPMLDRMAEIHGADVSYQGPPEDGEPDSGVREPADPPPPNLPPISVAVTPESEGDPLGDLFGP